MKKKVDHKVLERPTSREKIAIEQRLNIFDEQVQGRNEKQHELKQHNMSVKVDKVPRTPN